MSVALAIIFGAIFALVIIYRAKPKIFQLTCSECSKLFIIKGTIVPSGVVNSETGKWICGDCYNEKKQ